jgi:hypothetical protein
MATALPLNAVEPADVLRRPEASGFIIGPVADSVLIIGAPLVALLIAGPLFFLPSSTFEYEFRAKPYDLRQMGIVAFINAHLFLVYFRSHANQKIFHLYPFRFIAVPIGLFLAGATSPLALGLMGFLAIWWDVYHSSMQTFGFGRIYDAKQKNSAIAGRSLDYWMNLFVYLGPVLAGAQFVEHLNSSLVNLQYLSLQEGDWIRFFLRESPDFLRSHQNYLTLGVLATGIPFALYYLYRYYRLQAQGYHVSWQKVWLMLITSSVSIYCWGFHSFIDAFWVMNFFHALQYFAIVCFSERQNLTDLFRLRWMTHGWILALAWVITFSLIYGVWSGIVAKGNWSTSFVVTTSLMHFWYDGFIWSVKKKMV